jgi:hypothetical protein
VGDHAGVAVEAAAVDEVDEVLAAAAVDQDDALPRPQRAGRPPAGGEARVASPFLRCLRCLRFDGSGCSERMTTDSPARSFRVKTTSGASVVARRSIRPPTSTAQRMVQPREPPTTPLNWARRRR